MRILLITNDPRLSEMVERIARNSQLSLTIHNDSDDPLDIMSKICTTGPGLLIIDDDYVRPRSVHILKTIKKVLSNVSIVFVTSDASVKLGSGVSQLGIQYYALKPLVENHLSESLISIIKLKSNNLY